MRKPLLHQKLIPSLQGIHYMSNPDKVADLLTTGEEYLADLINQNNKTSYTPDDLIIGSPLASADQTYNTDIEVGFNIPVEGEPEPVPVLGLLHYDRFDLGRLFAKRPIQLRDNDYEDIHSLIVPFAEEVKVQFETTDLVNANLPAGFPKRVVIRADPLSLRFMGQFSVEITDPIVPDTAFITDPVIVANTKPARMAMKYDDTLVFGEGNLSDGMIVSSNGEIEVAGTARLSTYRGVFSSTDAEYRLDIADVSDWTLPYSFALIDKRNGDRLTDLYTCTVKITAQQGGGYLEFELKRQYGKLILEDTVNELYLSDVSCYNETQTLFQNIVRVTAFKHKLGSLSCNAVGAPYGTFTIELKAVRKTNDQDPVVVTYDVIVAGLEP
jgi:hypothetical protein